MKVSRLKLEVSTSPVTSKFLKLDSKALQAECGVVKVQTENIKEQLKHYAYDMPQSYGSSTESLDESFLQLVYKPLQDECGDVKVPDGLIKSEYLTENIREDDIQLKHNAHDMPLSYVSSHHSTESSDGSGHKCDHPCAKSS